MARLSLNRGSSSDGGNLLARLGNGGEDGDLLLGLHDGDHIGKRVLGTHLSSGVPGQHDLDLDTQDSLTEKNVTDGGINEVLGGLTRVDHESVNELHGLGTGTAELSGDNNLATLSARLHDVTDNTVAGTTNSNTVQKLVLQGLALSNGRETTEVDLLGVKLNSVLGELETLLDQRGQLTDATTLNTKNLLGLGGTDDDLSAGGGDADLDTGVTLSSELALEELVQLGVENTIGDELSLLADLSRGHVEIMESGGKGCEVVVSGKLRGARAKSMKFVDGFMIHSGQPTKDFVDTAVRHVLLRQGVLGVKVKIMLPWDPTGKMGPKNPLPDMVTIMEPKEEVPVTAPVSESREEVAPVAAAPVEVVA